MKCNYHPKVDAIGECIKCHEPVCVECKVGWEETTYCTRCVDEILGIEARVALQRKSSQKTKALSKDEVAQVKASFSYQKFSGAGEVVSPEPNKPRLPNFSLSCGDPDLKHRQEAWDCPTCIFLNQETVKKSELWCTAPQLPKMQGSMCPMWQWKNEA